MAQQVSTNTFGVSKWVVSPDPTQGTHTTITAAMASSSSGDTIYIRDGTYTENFTGKDGVTLTTDASMQQATFSTGQQSNVRLIGKISFSSGDFTVENIHFQTNSDFIFEVTGTLPVFINIVGCYFNCINNTGISFTNSDATSEFNVFNSSGDLATTGIAYWSAPSAGTMRFLYCNFGNTGLSTVNSDSSAGSAEFYWSQFSAPLSSNSTGGLAAQHCQFIGQFINSVPFIANGTGSTVVLECYFTSATTAGISVGAGCTVNMFGDNIVNTNGATAIQGAGSIRYNVIGMGGSGIAISATRTPLVTYVGSLHAFDAEIESSLTFDAGLIANVIATVGAGPHTITTANYFIAIDTSAAAPTINMPNAPATGQKFILKDASGNANVNNITVTTPGGVVTFDGLTSVTMNTNYRSISLIFNGSNYLIW